LIFAHKVLIIITPVIGTTSHGSMTHAFLISPSELLQLILFRSRLTTDSTYNPCSEHALFVSRQVPLYNVYILYVLLILGTN